MNNFFEIFVLVLQISIIFLILDIIYHLFRFHKTLKLEQRFARYSVELLASDDVSLSSNLFSIYNSIVSKISKFLLKIKIFDTYSKKYEKYIIENKNNELDRMNYISTKILFGIFGVFLLIVSSIIRSKKISLSLFIIVYLISFFALDLYLVIKNNYYKKRIERDMGRAISIMNNAFSSGYSIMQAIELVSLQMDGPISKEFKKMYTDIAFGLNMEVVLSRFANRVDCIEAHYLQASLAIVNKTGGNIIQVFEAVEKNALNHKKLKNELASTVGAARMMFKLLICIPIFLVILLLLLNPNYFNPLFTTPIGLMCLLLSIIIYTTYIIIIKKLVYMEVDL